MNDPPAVADPPDSQAAAARLELRAGWRLADPQLERDAISFWRRHGLLPPAVKPEDRARELAAAAYQEGELVGVTTAAISRVEFLRANFAVFRCAVHPARRRGHTAIALTVFTRDLIARWSLDNPAEKVAGLAAVIESQDLADRQRQPFWPTTRLGLVGHTRDGRQIRVAWFDHARLD